MKRILTSLFLACQVFVVLWLSGTDIEFRSIQSAFAYIVFCMLFAFCYGYPGWTDRRND